MCVALPMLVEAVDGYSLTVSRAGETKVVNAALIGDDVKPGEMVMVFIDQAIRRITPEEAAEVDSALGALGTVLAGDHRRNDSCWLWGHLRWSEAPASLASASG